VRREDAEVAREQAAAAAEAFFDPEAVPADEGEEEAAEASAEPKQA
jgi:hypothetical protein